MEETVPGLLGGENRTHGRIMARMRIVAGVWPVEPRLEFDRDSRIEDDLSARPVLHEHVPLRRADPQRRGCDQDLQVEGALTSGDDRCTHVGARRPGQRREQPENYERDETFPVHMKTPRISIG